MLRLRWSCVAGALILAFAVSRPAAAQAPAPSPAAAAAPRRVEAGSIHTCGVTTDDRAFCWGRNYHQILGDGTTNHRWTRPSAVVGGLQFNRINVGRSHTCALTPANRAYCWGGEPPSASWGTAPPRIV